MSGENARYEENWQSWVCADCDPANYLDPDEEPGPEYEKPYVLLVPEGDPVPDFCPRCGDYLSLCDSAKGLRITNTPAERWAREKAGS